MQRLGRRPFAPKQGRTYQLRVHFVGDFGSSHEDIQLRQSFGKNAADAAARFTEGADPCWVEVLSSNGRVIHTS